MGHLRAPLIDQSTAEYVRLGQDGSNEDLWKRLSSNHVVAESAVLRQYMGVSNAMCCSSSFSFDAP